MTDIIKRLKAKPPKGFVTSPLMIEAADEIERLRGVLKYYAGLEFNGIEFEPLDDRGALARKALKEKSDGHC